MSAPTPSPPGCEPVHREFGSLQDPANVALMADPRLNDVVNEVVDGVLANPAYTGTHNPTELVGGRGALRVIEGLGCASCELANVCAVRGGLETRVTESANAEKLTMLASAPRWLAVARLQRAGISIKQLQALSADIDLTAQVLHIGKLNLDELLGDVSNAFGNTHRKEDLPELAHLPGAVKNKQDALVSHTIMTPTGHAFSVIDASPDASAAELHNFEREYGVLCAKLLERMIDVDAQGLPHILTQDGRAQKTLENWGNVAFCEMRMGGKYRMYFTVLPSPEGPNGPTARVVILGSHGDSEQVQRQTIDSLLGRR